ncbi:lumenal Hsp70 protein [Peltigera leucophlebia]|nr:lumenal Hsp70 protein [Peltigera leucophlebia]
MPPHGKRRLSPVATLLSLLFLFAYTASAAYAVLGIDFGTEYIKAALVKPGIPLEIVLTKDSKRKEGASVAFKPLTSKILSSESSVFPVRIYGGDASALSARFPGDVYSNLKPLLGLLFKDNDVVAGYRGRYPGLRLVEEKERGTVGFQSESFAETEDPFLVEELIAMEFNNIRQNAKALAGKGSAIQDVVITVPSFYTAEERRAIKLAADLADLRILALISDGLSVGLNYATSRTFPSITEGGKPEYHLIYDMGAGSTTATVLRFQGKTIKDIGRYNKTIQEVQILGTGWDKTLGGDALNEIVMEDMIQQFIGAGRMKTIGVKAEHIKEHGRTMARLWKEAERIRQVLSANAETISSFEGLFYEDVNFKYKLSRTEFEKLTSGYAKRVQSPIKRALESARLSLSDLESVILHGGAVRTPFVQKQLESTIKNPEKIRTNVNSDEAAVFGAAFKAAGISPSFRVKDIRAGDIAGYAFGIAWSSGGKEKHQKLFIPTSHTGTEKQVTVKVTGDFSFALNQRLSDAPLEVPVAKIQTLNLTSSVQKLTERYGCAPTDVSTQFSVRLSSVDGLPEVTRGWVSCEVTETTEKKVGVVDGVKDFLGFGVKKRDQEPLRDDEDAKSSTNDPSGESSTVSSAKESKATDSEASARAEEDKLKEPKKRIETIHIAYSIEVAGSPPLSAKSLRRIKDRLIAFDNSDRSRIKREEALNTLEAFTYKARDYLEDEAFISASTDEQRAQIGDQFKSASEWLYGEGADATQEILKARLDELRMLIDPIQKRKDEAARRPEEVKALEDALQQTQTMVNLLTQERESKASAEEAASSASATESQPTEAPPPPSSDEFADLDNETSTSTTATVTETPAPPVMPVYTAEELAILTAKQESVRKWLNIKLAEQEKLSPRDEPALLSSDLAAKSKELNAALMDLLQKKMQQTPPKLSTGKTKTSKTKKAATKTVKAKISNTESADDAQKSEDVDDFLKKNMPGVRRVTAEELLGGMKGGKKGDKAESGREEMKYDENTPEPDSEETMEGKRTEKKRKANEKKKSKTKSKGRNKAAKGTRAKAAEKAKPEPEHGEL